MTAAERLGHNEFAIHRRNPDHLRGVHVQSSTSPRARRLPVSGSRVGSFRWVICGLLFFATTINYIDRQVLGILAPDLQHDIGWSELDYGRIVIAFQLSYAVMMLFWGTDPRQDRHEAGIRASRSLWWSLAAMGRRSRARAMGFGAARFLLGVGEAANFPGVDQDGRRMVSEERAGVRDGHLQRRHERRRGPRADHRAAGSRGVGLAGRVHPDRRAGFHLADRVVGDLPAGRHASAAVGAAERQYIHDGAEEPSPRRCRCRAVLGTRQLWAFAIGKLMTDPIWWFYLFWLPKFLAQEHGIRGVALIPLPDDGLHRRRRWLGGWRLPVVGAHQEGWTVNAARKTTMGIFAAIDSRGDHRAAGEERVGRGRLDQPRDIVPSGVVREPVHAGVRHVPAARVGTRRRLWRLRRRHRRNPDRGIRGPHAAGGSELLPADVHRRGPRVFRGAGRDPAAGAAARAGQHLTGTS